MTENALKPPEKKERLGTAVEAIRFLSKNIEYYNIINDKFDCDIKENARVLEFFSRPMLHERGWSVIPLWEGEIDTLLLEDRTPIPFMERLCELSLKTGGQYLYATHLCGDSLTYSCEPGTASRIVHARRFDLVNNENPADVFQDNHYRYLGKTNFFWSSNERFLIYSDGDNAAFIAGDRQEILDSLLGGLKYDYCVKRLIGAHKQWLKDFSVINAWINFCDEFI